MSDFKQSQLITQLITQGSKPQTENKKDSKTQTDFEIEKTTKKTQI